jgi:hypothetical protein
MIYRYIGGGYLAQRELTVNLGFKETELRDFHLKFVMWAPFSSKVPVNMFPYETLFW